MTPIVGNIPTISEKVICCFDIVNSGRPIFTRFVIPRDEKSAWDSGTWDSNSRQRSMVGGQ